MGLKTAFLLAAQYEGRATISIETVCRDFFGDLTPDKFLRKVGSGEIKLPVIRMYPSQKAAKAVLLTDLADYLDGLSAAARKEIEQLSH